MIDFTASYVKMDTIWKDAENILPFLIKSTRLHRSTSNMTDIQSNTTIPSEQEEWRPAVGFEGHYEVSNHGRVRSFYIYGRRFWGDAPTRMMRFQKNKKGYLGVMLRPPAGKPRLKRVHVLVMAAFIGPCPDGREVNHKNRVKHDNHLCNLEYVTPSENARHAELPCLPRWRAIGCRVGSAKLTESDIPRIRALAAAGMTFGRIAKIYSMCRSTIGAAIRRKTWKHVE